MIKPIKITVLPGDGVGPEVCDSAVRLLDCAVEQFGLDFSIEEHSFGGAAIHKSGTPFPEETIAAVSNSDAVLLGAVGLPEFETHSPAERPEAGLLKLRTVLGGFANLRPAKAFESILDGSPLKREVFAGTDLLIVRELLGGLYFGAPREKNEAHAYNTMSYSKPEIERVARVAFASARQRGGRICSVDKANVLETSMLWRETVSEVAAAYPDVALEHMYVDACAMKLVTDPKHFDVILTENMFGDILSDEAAVLTGSLGMLPSATIGGDVDLYEPIHGSAPDIAGKNLANPIGAILSVAMMMRHSFGREDAAAAIEDAVHTTLESGLRTRDLMGGERVVGTIEMTDAIVASMHEHASIGHAYHAV
ncbi:MAG: 3-isopropylmalate dehydrogenase [Pyrinomonadaceae bacterium]